MLPVMIGSADLAAANTEAASMTTAARSYFTEKGFFPSTSDYLIPIYFYKAPKAKYYFNTGTGLITRVDSMPGGWTNIAFSISKQAWIKGNADNNHSNDLDLP